LFLFLLGDQNADFCSDMKKLRIVYMGTPEFAVPSLEALIREGHHVCGVVTVADKPSGRGLQLSESPVKKVAVKNGIPVLQPEKLKAPEFIASLSALQADLFIVVAFRMLPEIVWNMPPLGTINLHGSLLPKYRGAAPINRAIMNGETETGVTVFQLQHEIDTGRVFLRRPLSIGPDENASSLHDRMMMAGAEALVDAVDAIANGSIKSVDQSQLSTDMELPHAPKIFKEDCIIQSGWDVDKVHNHVRGLAYYPAAFTILEGKQMKVFQGRPEKTGRCETGFSSDGKRFLKIACSNGWYHLEVVQLEGKKRMSIEEFLRGHRIVQG
jgi:methionyl-tRNA formyltransferase